MKTLLIAIALIIVPISLTGASATNSVLAMTKAPYIKWQSERTSDETRIPDNLINGIAGFLSSNGEKLGSVVSELEKTGLNYDTGEITHLKDVKSVFENLRTANKSSLFFLAISVTVLLLFKGVIFTLKMLYRISFAVTIFLLILAVASYLGFDLSFDLMHKLLFKDGTWLFTQESFLIKLFPYDFWRNSAAIALAGSTGQIAGIGLASRLLLKRLI